MPTELNTENCPICGTQYAEEGPAIGPDRVYLVRSCEAQGLDDIDDDEELFAALDAHVTHHWDAKTGALLPWVLG